MTRAPSLAFRSLRARPIRTLLTTAAVVLGVAVILAISITNLSTIRSITTLFTEASGKAHLVVRSSNISDPGFAEGILGRIATLPGIKAAVPTLQVQALQADEVAPMEIGVSFFGAVGGGITIYGIDSTVDTEARDYKIVEGRFLSTDPEAQEIVLVKDYADDKKLKVGSEFRVSVPDGSEVLNIVGLMSREGPGQINNGAFGTMPLKAAQRIYARLGDLDQIDIVATPEAATGAELDKLKAVQPHRVFK